MWIVSFSSLIRMGNSWGPFPASGIARWANQWSWKNELVNRSSPTASPDFQFSVWLKYRPSFLLSISYCRFQVSQSLFLPSLLRELLNTLVSLWQLLMYFIFPSIIPEKQSILLFLGIALLYLSVPWLIFSEWEADGGWLISTIIMTFFAAHNFRFLAELFLPPSASDESYDSRWRIRTTAFSALTSSEYPLFGWWVFRVLLLSRPFLMKRMGRSSVYVVSYFYWWAKDGCIDHYPKYLKNFMSEDKVHLRHPALFTVFSVALESEKQMSYIPSLWSFYLFLETEAGKHKGKYPPFVQPSHQHQCASKCLSVKFIFAYLAPNTGLHIQ